MEFAVTTAIDIEDKPEPLTHQLVKLDRRTKRAILIGNDFLLLAAAMWLALTLRWGEPYWPPTAGIALLLAAAPLIGVGTLVWRGFYRFVTRFLEGGGLFRLVTAIALATVIWSLLVLMSGTSYGDHVIPRSVPFLFALLSVGFIMVSRQVAGIMLRNAHSRLGVAKAGEPRRVVIWGAGIAGVHLLEAISRDHNYLPIGLVDGNETLWGQHIGSHKVYRPEKLAKLIERDGVREVLVAMPDQQRRERREVLRRLEGLPVRVKVLPDATDIASGRVSVSDLRSIEIEDLLGREPVPADPALLSRDIRGRSVLVTGAGGSIGSELTRQVLRQHPKKLVLLELSEVALYEIGMELAELLARAPSGAAAGGEKPPELVSLLGSVLDCERLKSVIREHGIETIFHAAAYKHVPIVEHNPLIGLANNVLGTRSLAEAARACAVRRVILISTDKAVRPTNVMGASKRMAELIFQAEAMRPATDTVFTMVRFGNVLDSSGSVVRRFRRQIEAGGPVTVTHREMVRYFMSIPEAATLVIQAGAMAEGGEVFVLDMGEPVRILDLARSMVRLMGLEVRDEGNPDGDIDINFVGLRPGEKLYEELWLTDDIKPTEHPRIKRKHEPALALTELQREIAVLEAAIAARDVEAARSVLLRTVEGYRPDGGDA